MHYILSLLSIKREGTSRKWSIGIAQKEGKQDWVGLYTYYSTTHEFPAQVNQQHKHYIIVASHDHLAFCTKLTTLSACICTSLKVESRIHSTVKINICNNYRACVVDLLGVGIHNYVWCALLYYAYKPS